MALLFIGLVALIAYFIIVPPTSPRGVVEARPTVAPLPAPPPLLPTTVPGKPGQARPKASPEARAYANRMQALLERTTKAANTLVERLPEARSNPLLLANSEWKAQVNASLQVFRDSAREIRAYSPVPKEVARLHAQALLVADDLEYIANEYQAGIDGLNLGRINNATERMQSLPSRSEALRREAISLQNEYEW